MPLYQLLGGKSRNGVMVYGHANGADIAETVDEVAKFLDLGYKAVRAQCGIPGLPSTYGVSKDKMFYEPADADLPTENLWSSEKYLDHVPQLFERPARHIRLRPAPPARRPPPADADRGGTARQVAGALPPVLDGGRGAGGQPCRVPHHPPAHGDADRHRRDLPTPCGSARP